MGTAHVGQFGGRKKVAEAQGEPVEALPASWLTILNADAPGPGAMPVDTDDR